MGSQVVDLIRLGEPLGGHWGTRPGHGQYQPFKKLYKNPLGKPSSGNTSPDSVTFSEVQVGGVHFSILDIGGVGY